MWLRNQALILLISAALYYEANLSGAFYTKASQKYLILFPCAMCLASTAAAPKRSVCL